MGNKQDDQRKSQSIPQDQSEVSSTATEDQSYHSSKYSVDHSVTLSAISGELGNQVSLSTVNDSSDFDPGIRNFASDDRWKEQDDVSSIQSSRKSDTLEQMSVATSKDGSW